MQNLLVVVPRGFWFSASSRSFRWGCCFAGSGRCLGGGFSEPPLQPFRGCLLPSSGYAVFSYGCASSCHGTHFRPTSTSTNPFTSKFVFKLSDLPSIRVYRLLCFLFMVFSCFVLIYIRQLLQFKSHYVFFIVYCVYSALCQCSSLLQFLLSVLAGQVSHDHVDSSQKQIQCLWFYLFDSA